MLIHVVSLVGAVGDDGVEGVLESLDGVCGGFVRGLLKVVLRNEGEELADDGDSVLLGVCGEVCDTALGSVYRCTAELLLCNHLACY